jgi:hypothetical protein
LNFKNIAPTASFFLGYRFHSLIQQNINFDLEFLLETWSYRWHDRLNSLKEQIKMLKKVDYGCREEIFGLGFTGAEKLLTKSQTISF